MSNLCIIPARGGSKRIPRKNIKHFMGKPIIAYSILTAIKSGVYDTVMVSTDDEEIRNVAIKYGAEVPFLRSEENSNDTASTSAVLEEVLNYYGQGEYELATCLYPTAPFVSEEKLKRSIQMLDDGVDATFSVARFSSPIQRALQMDENGMTTMVQPEHRWTRSQDLEPIFFDAGQFYSFKVDQFMCTKDLWAKNCKGIELSELEVQDIDSLVDWKLAELKYQMLQYEER